MTFAMNPLFFFAWLQLMFSSVRAATLPAEFLFLGDGALAREEFEKALEYYENGIRLVEKNNGKQNASLGTIVSLQTNYATALSSVGKIEEAAAAYEEALVTYKDKISGIKDVKSKDEITKIVAESSFYLGMVYQDLDRTKDAIDAYSYAHALDPLHWASLANLGSVLHDNLKIFRGALAAYNKAYTILNNIEHEPTNPPPEPRFILSQLQYRIGLCISNDLNQKCILDDDTKNPVDCKEMAAHAFSLAIEYDPENSQAAKHMLATITADATMKRASNEYVKSLFDDYAHNFEHSLVEELGYTGYKRLREAFDRAFSGTANVPTFDVVFDAGCGTGLVGEQFRNVSRTLVGVDLSEAILQEALLARPKLYDEVLAGDVTEIFRQRKPINLIIAGDSYIYFGDLEPLFASMLEGLSFDGYVAFTLENVSMEDEETLAETKPDWRWRLTASGRFAHRKEYVLSVGKENGLTLVYYESLENFRYEHGIGVRGHIFVMKKQRLTNEEL